MMPLKRPELSTFYVALLLVGAFPFLPAPAAAQFGLPGGVSTRILNDAARAIQQGAPSSRSHTRRRRGSEDGGEEAPSRNSSRKGDAEASARAARQMAAIEAELMEIDRAKHMEQERNVDTGIREFIKALADGHDRLLKQSDRVVRATRGEINQVTAGQVRSAIEEAYDKANLRDFEKYTGELWTRDRLLVRILRSSAKGLRPYFEGVGAKGPDMADLKVLFQKSAREVFAKALETSEVIGVSKSFDRFIRTIYEQSDSASEALWTTGADSKYERLTSLTIERSWRQDQVEKEFGAVVADTEGLDRQFLYRFRARRALYECLSVTYPELTRGDGSMTAELKTSSGARTGQGILGPNLTPGESEALWVKVRSHLDKRCQGLMTKILVSAKSGGIGPLSSRDSGLPSGSLQTLVGEQR